MPTSHLFFDGGLGTMLQAAGLPAHQPPEVFSLTHPETLIAIHYAYLEAGANILCSNTFGVNGLKYPATHATPADVLVRAAVGCAKEAIRRFEQAYPENRQPHLVALDIGPTGRLLAPLGDLTFEDAVEAFAVSVREGVESGVDLIAVETMNDLYEAKAAVLAAKEAGKHPTDGQPPLPISASMVFNQQGRTLTGADAATAVTLLEGLGVSAVGLNCSLGPDKMKDAVSSLVHYATVPVVVCPNAGLPLTQEGKTVYPCDPDTFAAEMLDIVRTGAGKPMWLGGCCGTTPAHILALHQAVEELHLTAKDSTQTQAPPAARLSGRTYAVAMEDMTLVKLAANDDSHIAEAILQAVDDGDFDPLIDIAMEALDDADAEDDHKVTLCISIDTDGDATYDVRKMLPATVIALESMLSCPLVLESRNAAALLAALRVSRGRCGVIWTGEGDAEAFAAQVAFHGGAMMHM